METKTKNVDMKQLCQTVTKEIGEEKSFYDLEPILEDRPKNVTEKLLVTIFLNSSNLCLMNLVKLAMKIEPSLLYGDAGETVKSVLYGTIQIYPSELKRADIPLALYRYVISDVKNKDYDIQGIKRFWSLRFSCYENNEFSLSCECITTFILYYCIGNTMNPSVNLMLKKIIQLKVPEYFYFLDCALSSSYLNYSDKQTEMTLYLSEDISKIVVKKSLQKPFMCDVYTTTYKALNKMLNEILNVLSDGFLYHNSLLGELCHPLVQKYFEYRMVRHKETKLFNEFSFKEILDG